MAKITITDDNGIIFTQVVFDEQDIQTPVARQFLMDVELLHDMKLAIKADLEK